MNKTQEFLSCAWSTTFLEVIIFNGSICWRAIYRNIVAIYRNKVVSIYYKYYLIWTNIFHMYKKQSDLMVLNIMKEWVMKNDYGSSVLFFCFSLRKVFSLQILLDTYKNAMFWGSSFLIDISNFPINLLKSFVLCNVSYYNRQLLNI